MKYVRKYSNWLQVFLERIKDSLIMYKFDLIREE